MTKQQMTQVIEEHLSELPQVLEIELVPGSVRKEGKWWTASVRARHEPPRQWRYYEILADTETEIEDEHGVKLMLVPVTWSEPAEPAERPV